MQERDIGDEYGWKQVHGDVFRPPVHLLWFSTFIGIGYQLATVAVAVILIAIAGDLYTRFVCFLRQVGSLCVSLALFRPPTVFSLLSHFAINPR